MDCVAIGDSIAVGVGQAAGCMLNAKVGASSTYIADHVITYDKHAAVISAGSNDPSNPHLRANLNRIRYQVKAPKVIWILPYDRQAAEIVRSVALHYRDSYVDLHSYPSNDRIHPKSYRSLSDSIFN